MSGCDVDGSARVRAFALADLRFEARQTSFLVRMNPHLQRAMIGVIEDQLRSPNTPEVLSEYERLLALGIPDGEAKALMAKVVMPHVYRLAQSKAMFDYSGYIDELRELPGKDP